MKNTLIGFICASILITVGMVLAQPSDQHGYLRLPTDVQQSAARACMFPSGGWTIVNCSNVAAASSAALNAWSRYVIQCGVNSYLATGTAATGQDADTNDGYLPAGAWLEFMTTDTIKYISCLNIGSDSDCRLVECR